MRWLIYVISGNIFFSFSFYHFIKIQPAVFDFLLVNLFWKLHTVICICNNSINSSWWTLDSSLYRRTIPRGTEHNDLSIRKLVELYPATVKTLTVSVLRSMFINQRIVRGCSVNTLLWHNIETILSNLVLIMIWQSTYTF